MLVYISCPVVNGDYELAETRMTKAARQLLEDGHQPALPTVKRGEQSEVMSAAVRDAVNSDGVMFLNGWRKDVVCQMVHYVAMKLDKILMYNYEILDFGKLGKKAKPQGN